MSSMTMHRGRNGGLLTADESELFLPVPERVEPEPANCSSSPKTAPPDFPSCQKIALAELRRACPELKRRNLLAWECRNFVPSGPVDALLASRHCGVSGHFARPDSPEARVLSCAEDIEEMAEWRAKILGDGAFHYELESKKFAQVMISRRDTGISRPNIADGVIEIRRKGEQERLWLVMFARLGEGLQPGRFHFIVHEPGGHGLRNAYLSLCGKVRDHIKGVGSANRTIQIANSYGETLTFTGQDWNDIYMTDEVRRGMREDFRFFVENEAWFRRKRLPFKRGYLLVGPPGNGKTTALRAMAGTPGFNAFTFDFTRGNHNSNDDLIRAFKKADDEAPCIFMMEDVDRIFCQREEKQTQVLVTRDTLLNCLDGVSQNDGMVVVATANHPEDLDEAILRRPGRFDRVVRFDPPDHAMRLRILTDLFAEEREVTADPSFLHGLADATNGFSMASMKELYIAAANEAFQDGGDISTVHAKRALELMRKQYDLASGGRRVGFGR